VRTDSGAADLQKRPFDGAFALLFISECHLNTTSGNTWQDFFWNFERFRTGKQGHGFGEQAVRTARNGPRRRGFIGL